MVWNIAAECISTVFLCIIWAYSRRRNLLPTLKNKLFQVCFFVTFCAMLFNIASTVLIVYYMVMPLWINWVVATVYFVATPLMGVAYYYYAISILYEHAKKPLQLIWLSCIPAVVYLAMVILNPWTHSLFDISLEQGYVRGSNIAWTYVVFYIYCIGCLALVPLRGKNVHVAIRRILAVFPAIAAVVVFFQQLFPTVILSGSAATCAMLIIYLNLQNKQSYIDRLLRIPNRDDFLETLDLHLSKRSGQPLQVMVFSLRDFKQIADNYGQQIGDEFLKGICGYLQQTVTPLPLYRFDGDEFAVLAAGKSDEWMKGLAQEVLERVEAPWQAKGIECKVRMAAAVVRYPECATQMEDIINGLEYAISCAKDGSAPKFCRCTLKMVEELKRKRQVIDVLEDALRRDAFEVYFQPIWSVEQRRFTLAESLLRLPESALGALYPSEMIPLAEETGLIVDITYQVLEKTCKFVRELEKQGIEIESVTVNFSGVQFTQMHLAEKVFEIIARNGVPYHKIKIEITESVLAHNIRDMELFMEQMHEQGVQIGIDDFGTGYGNLVSVLNMPADVIKLDKSLIWSAMESENFAILMRNIAQTVGLLGMKLVAEGIETKEHADFAQACGCEWLQGYLYARPMPFAEAVQTIAKAQGKI